MVHFPSIRSNWHTITHRTVESLDNSDEIDSLKGRGISLLHTLATPLKAWSGLGKLAQEVLSIGSIVLGVVTLNQHPRNLKQAGAYVIDVAVGTVLLAVALVAHSIRGIAGTIFHPGAMIRRFDNKDGDLPGWGVEHNLLQGTLVNYYMPSYDRPVHFPNIEKNWTTITERTVECLDDADDITSLKGRGISFIHTIATPLKAFTGLGKLTQSALGIASIVLSVITLNTHPKDLDKAGANVIDVGVGGVLLPVALVANAVRGVVGTLFHPGAMIRGRDFYTWEAKHNILQGTLVNY